MMDFAAARRMMVDGQIRTADVTDLRLVAAMLDVARERFVPHVKAALAYLDFDLPVTPDVREGDARCLLKPVVLAKMIQAADVEEGDNVLDLGCATGYSAWNSRRHSSWKRFGPTTCLTSPSRVISARKSADHGIGE